MNLVTNNLNQPQTIGEETLPADGQIVVESIDKRTRRLETRGFVSISKVEETVFEQEPVKAVETKTIGNQSKKEQK